MYLEIGAKGDKATAWAQERIGSIRIPLNTERGRQFTRQLGDVLLHDSHQAHQIAHVNQQRGLQRRSQGAQQAPVPMSQMNRATRATWQSDTPTKQAFRSTAPLRDESKHRSLVSPNLTLPENANGRLAGQISPPAADSTLQRTETDSVAQMNEEAVTVARESSTRTALLEVDPQEIADKVYRLMMQEVILERERGVVTKLETRV